MDLDLISKYTHKIKKIHIKNTNRYSLRNCIVLKIHIDVKDTETIRFSLKENSGYIGHQQQDDDFFIRVPNNLVASDGKPTITTIYAHFFDKELYQYKEEHKQIFSEFDFSQLQTTKSNGYRLITDTDNKTAKVQSILANSIDGYKNPNYKQYADADDEKLTQGYFPITSKYRSKYLHPSTGFYESAKYYWNAPYLLNQGTNMWTASILGPGVSNQYWMAKIKREDLSPLISDGVENTHEDTPLNVFLNYNYLPTSTEYHEHLFGFEDTLEDNNKYYNILEGENLDVVSDAFGSHNNYRIIQLSNPFNDKYSMSVNKKNIIGIDLNTMQPHNCTFNYNQCYGYYTYKATNNASYCSKVIQLKEGTTYTLKYYIYIPDTMSDTDEAYMRVNDVKLHPTFRQQDKLLREQWIYHEIPFISEGTDVIYIIGPQQIQEDNVCYLINVSIEEMIEYSPTIKYNQKGIQLIEGDTYTSRPISGTDTYNDTLNTHSKQWTPQTLPLIRKRVYFLFNRNKNIYYDKLNKILYYIHDTDDDDFNIQYDKSTGDLSITEDEEISLYIDNEKNIIAEYDTDLIFTKSIGNHFEVFLRDINDNSVNDGIVEAAIHDSPMTEKDDLTTALKYLGQHNVNNSKVEFSNIDLSNLQLTNNQDTIYYLNLKYINPCSDISFIYQTIILQNPQYTLTPMSRNINIDIDKTFIINKNNQLPLQIQCKITNQLQDIVTGGYVDLSIDDHETQSTIVDTNGIADFYLDLDDLKYGLQTIKLEYFTKNYHPIKYIYFKVNNLIENKPTLPFIVKGIVQEDKTLPIDINDYTHELQSITDTQTYDLDFNPLFMDIDIDIPSGIMNANLVLQIYRNNTLVHTYTLNHIPDESLIFIDDFNDNNDGEVEYQFKKSSKQTVTYKIALMSNTDYRYNDVDIHLTHY